MQVTIAEHLGQRGEGIAETADGRIFVPFALPGETAEIDAVGERGTLRALLGESPHRITPFCPHFTRCGGCALQHLDAPSYSAFKRGLVELPLRRAGLDTAVDDLVVAHGLGRRRATLHARREGAGFMQARSHQVHDLDYCPIVVPALKRAPTIARAVHAAVGEADVAFTATATGLDVAVRTEKKRSRPEKLTPLLAEHRLARLALNGEIILQATVPVVRMGASAVDLPVGSFLQATEEAEAVLAGLVAENLGAAKKIADLFCGVGPFALRLATERPVYAADSDKPGIAALAKAARNTPGLKPITAQARDLFREPLTIHELSFDAVVFDPPRAGAEAQARELANSKVKTVVAVSCDPKTFARDAAILVAGGYRLERVTPVDQFAYSPHIEIVARFSR